ncbi:hypothetical protein [uncultured Porphyromonas sp.]|uniref:hypothetical protein n=1 Tax=uncultured Porphyromonas sp. TaxID=159274 RepID=UPI0026039A54|nr:hypothetical protein [uncultured Porphyromonas sp.]
MNKILNAALLTALTLSLTLLLGSCKSDSDTPDAPSAITLDRTEVTVPCGGTAQVIVTAGSGDYSVVLPQVTTATAVTHGDTIILHGKADGQVSGVVRDNLSGMTAQLKVSVTSAQQLLRLSQYDAGLPIGSYLTLSVLSGSGDYTAEVADEVIASAKVVPSGIRIVGLKEGNTTVSVKDNATGAVGKCEITVSMRAFKLDLPELPLTFPYGETRIIGILSGNGTYSVKSADTAIAGVEYQSGQFVITGIKPGKTTVTLTDDISGVSREVEVVITLKPLLLDFQAEMVEVLQGYDTTLRIISGNGAYELTADEALFTAELREDLIVLTPKSNGDGKLIIKDTKSGEVKELDVRVRDLIHSGRVTLTSVSIRVGETAKIEVLNASDWDYYMWSIKDGSLASLYTRGGWGEPFSCTVKGIKPGKTIIQLSTSDWGSGAKVIEEIPVTVTE